LSSELTTQQEAFTSVKALIAKPEIQSQIGDLLPDHISLKKLNALALVAFRKQPALFTECDRQSLLGALLEAAQLGLEIGTLGHCWLVALYNTKAGCKQANMWIGYRGMASLAYRSGMIADIEAHAVYDGDEFDYQFGTGKFIKHKPSDDADRSKITHFYSIINTTTSGTLMDVMTLADVEKIRNHSPGKNSPMWTNHYAEGGKKTVFRRLAKYAPCSTELSRAITLDEQAEIGLSQDLGDAIDVTPKDGEVPIAADVPAGENEEPDDAS
jgi:recombination protein RecT